MATTNTPAQRTEREYSREGRFEDCVGAGADVVAGRPIHHVDEHLVVKVHVVCQEWAPPRGPDRESKSAVVHENALHQRLQRRVEEMAPRTVIPTVQAGIKLELTLDRVTEVDRKLGELNAAAADAKSA